MAWTGNLDLGDCSLLIPHPSLEFRTEFLVKRGNLQPFNIGLWHVNTGLWHGLQHRTAGNFGAELTFRYSSPK